MLSLLQDLAPKGWAELRPWVLTDLKESNTIPATVAGRARQLAALQPASFTELGGKDVLGGEGLNLAANTCIYQNQSLLFKSLPWSHAGLCLQLEGKE